MFDVWLSLVGGFFLLVAGGELLVRGAVQVASRLGVSPLVIGLTLVGFGTSTPELVTSVQAALSQSPGIAYGNIVGSNIANILLIGGVSAVFFPIAITSAALRGLAKHTLQFSLHSEFCRQIDLDDLFRLGWYMPSVMAVMICRSAA